VSKSLSDDLINKFWYEILAQNVLDLWFVKLNFHSYFHINYAI